MCVCTLDVCIPDVCIPDVCTLDVCIPDVCVYSRYTPSHCTHTRWIVQERGFPLDKLASGPLRFFMFAVTIVVVAVPEGLPLAVTISLGYR